MLAQGLGNLSTISFASPVDRVICLHATGHMLGTPKTPFSLQLYQAQYQGKPSKTRIIDLSVTQQRLD